MAVLKTGTIRYTMVDERGFTAEHWLWLPTDAIAPTDTSQARGLAYTDVMSPLVTAELTRLVITIPYDVTESALNTPAAGGMEAKQRCNFRMYPGYKKRALYLGIPAFKASLLRRSPASKRKTWAHLEGASLDLVNAWIKGIGGIAPCNTYEQDFTAAEIGILQTKGNT